MTSKTKMTTLAVAVLGLALVAGMATRGVTQSAGETEAPARVAFVDVEMLIEESQAIRRALDRIDEEMAALARDIDAKEREFRRLRFDLDRQERVLSGEERERRREELTALQDEIGRMQFQFDQELRGRERQIEPVLQKVMEIVADVADRDGYDVVFRGEVVIYGRQSANITAAVAAELDRRADEIGAVFGAAPEEPGSGPRTEQTRPGAPPAAEDVLPMIP